MARAVYRAYGLLFRRWKQYRYAAKGLKRLILCKYFNLLPLYIIKKPYSILHNE